MIGATPSARAQRRVAAGVLALAAAFASACAAAATLPRVGLLSFFAAPDTTNPDSTETSFRQGLRDAGYVEGENIVIERRYAEGRPDRLAAMADELVRLKVDVILAPGQAPREAARKATNTIPIVTLSGGDPVREGWAKSLARPGGNLTGLTFTFPELGPKRLELLKEAVPALTRVAVLINPIDIVDVNDVLRETEAAARRLGVALSVLEVHRAEEFEQAIARARRERAQGVLAIAMWAHRDRLARLAAQAGLATAGETAQEAQAGFLLAYGADLDDLVRRAVRQMARILKGERAGEMPIERPSKFGLSVNLRTAKALGIAVPDAFLLRADEVIR
jgi:putative tryptophan/tyrosine transport system substrate-binding protein